MRATGMSRLVGRSIRVGVLALAAVALTGDASSEPDTEKVSATRWVSVSTGLVTFRPGKALRVSAVEVDGSRSTREARLSILDGKRRVRSQIIGQLTPLAPIFLDLARSQVPPGGDPAALPIRAEYQFPCDGDTDSGPITSLEVYDTATQATEATIACGCPCCISHTIPPGVAVDCGGGQRVVNLASAP